MTTKVEKRNGSIVDFDWMKIVNAIKKTFNACNIEDIRGVRFTVASRIYNQLDFEKRKDPVTINEIQNMVENELMKCAVSLSTEEDQSLYEVTKRYAIFRNHRDTDRETINKLTSTFKGIVEIEDNNTNKSNANINSKTPAGQMMIFASESSKSHAFDYIVSPKYVKAHKDGYIHIHDADYISTKAINCNQIDLVDLFSHDFIKTPDSIMRKPKRIGSYAALAAIALQSEQNEMFGGQSIHSWDYAMAKGVALTFREHFKEYLDIYVDQNNFVLKMEYSDEDIKMGNESLKEDYPWAYKKALEKTRRDTHEAMVAFIANMGSMHSRSGAQVVFSSINYGTDDSPEGRMVIEETLNAIDEGLGDGSTPIFPISVFRVKEGLSFSEEDWELAKNNWEDAVNGKIKFKAPNMDLFIKACEVSARRLFPNFVYEDTPFNHNPLWKEDDPNRYKYEPSTINTPVA